MQNVAFCALLTDTRTTAKLFVKQIKERKEYQTGRAVSCSEDRAAKCSANFLKTQLPFVGMSTIITGVYQWSFAFLLTGSIEQFVIMCDNNL